MTPQSIAAEINELKPDLTDFWKELSNLSWGSTLKLSNNTSLNLFKFELTSLLNIINTRFYVYSDFNTARNAYYAKVKFTPHHINYGHKSNVLTDITSEQGLISAHINNLKQYLNPYLRKKLGFVKTKARISVKLQDNEFSLKLFRNALGKRRIASTEAQSYFDQVIEFEPTIRDKFMDVIFEHCTPSTAFLKQIAQSGKFSFKESTSDKYIPISRQWIRNLAYDNRTLGTHDTFNEQDSSYVPFICGIPRKCTPNATEVSALFNMMSIVLMTNHKQKQYIADCIKEHLSLPEYADAITTYAKSLRTQVNTISNLLEEF